MRKEILESPSWTDLSLEDREGLFFIINGLFFIVGNQCRQLWGNVFTVKASWEAEAGESAGPTPGLSIPGQQAAQQACFLKQF